MVKAKVKATRSTPNRRLSQSEGMTPRQADRLLMSITLLTILEQRKLLKPMTIEERRGLMRNVRGAIEKT